LRENSGTAGVSQQRLKLFRCDVGPGYAISLYAVPGSTALLRPGVRPQQYQK